MNHIAKLPIAIFLVVQEYSQQKDYRRLINSNSDAFKTVKQETAYYAWKVSTETEKRLQRHIANIIYYVKDKSKQIAMTIDNLDQASVVSYAQYYEGIKQFTLDGFQQTFNSQLSFSMFANIYYLTLRGIKGIRQAHLYLDKTIELELILCDFEEIVDWREKHSMKEVIIHGCDKLISFPCLKGIPVVSITTHNTRLSNFQIGGQTKLCFDGRSITLQTMLQITSQPTSFFESLTYLQLRCLHFPTEFQDYSIFQNIPVLYLMNNLGYGRISQSPIFPRVFTGRKLALSYFNLSLWSSGQSFPNVESCKLQYCHDLVQLPEMPKLKTLVIESCHQLSAIPSLPSLTHLIVNSINNLVSISGCGLCLKFSRIENCGSLEHPFGFDSVEQLLIRNCPKIKTIPDLECVRILDIHSCNKLDLRSSRREKSTSPRLFSNTFVSLTDLSIADFSFCRDLYLLSLTDLPQLRNFSGIGNIQELSVENCHNLITTEGLEGFIGRIDIRNCSLLTTVCGILSSTAVRIYHCPKFSEFEGFDNRSNVTINGCQLFPVIKNK
jgi:hypothetical protein